MGKSKYEELDLELRVLRAKKLEAETEIKSLFNQKISILKEIKRLRLDVIQTRDNNKVDKNKLDNLRKEIRAIDKKREDDARELQSDKKTLLSIQDDIDTARTALSKREKAVEAKLEIIRERESIVKEAEAKNKDIASALKEREAIVKEGEYIVKDLRKDLEEKKRALVKSENSFMESLDKAQQTKKLLEMRVSELDVQKREIKAAREVVITLKKQLEEKEETQAKSEILLSAKNDELDKVIRSNEMTRRALEIQQKELERDKLQFQKLLREKGLEEELKNLKKALA